MVQNKAVRTKDIPDPQVSAKLALNGLLLVKDERRCANELGNEF